MTKMKQSSLKKCILKGISLPLALVFSLVLPISPITPTPSGQAPQVLKIAANKRVEVSICADSMNRIAVANDRITQIFGDEGTFESQNDEATGQLFLKPTLENGAKDLSLTLITEQGVTQDLTLRPTAKSAKTIILEHGPAGQRASSHNTGNQGFKDNQGRYLASLPSNIPEPHPDPAFPAQGQLLTVLKQAIQGQLPVSEEGYAARSFPGKNYALAPSQAWQAGPYIVQAITVENVTDNPLELHEKDFYQPGDLALGFVHANDASAAPFAPQPGALAPQQEATLYVVRFGGAN